MNVVGVYGTLRKGGYFHSVLQNSRYLGTRELSGFVMYDLGTFPGVQLSPETEDTIVVEMYAVDDETMQALDYIEGCRPGSASNLYDRITVPNVIDTGVLHLYIKCGNISHLPLVPGGDYAKYRGYES